MYTFIYIIVIVWKLQHSICFKKFGVHTPLIKLLITYAIRTWQNVVMEIKQNQYDLVFVILSCISNYVTNPHFFWLDVQVQRILIYSGIVAVKVWSATREFIVQPQQIPSYHMHFSAVLNSQRKVHVIFKDILHYIVKIYAIQHRATNEL